MVVARVTASGQVSLPAEVRRRWGTRRVVIDDEGERLVLRPMPDDPIGFARGFLKDRATPSEQAKDALRSEEAAVEGRAVGAP